MEEWGIDVLTGTSGKALSAMPGVGIVVVKDGFLDSRSRLASEPHYLDLHTHLTTMRDLAQTPNTPAVHVFVSLHASLTDTTLQGAARSRAVIRSRASYARERLAVIGLDYSDYGETTSSVLTCVRLPGQVPFDELAGQLKRRGIVVYNGKGPLENRLFQIGHIGALRRNDTRNALRHVEAAMRRGVHGAAPPPSLVPSDGVARAAV